MFSITRKFKRRAPVLGGIVAGMSFLALAVFGWEVPLGQVISFLLISILFLLIIVVLAMVIAYAFILIRKLKRNNNSK